MSGENNDTNNSELIKNLENEENHDERGVTTDSGDKNVEGKKSVAFASDVHTKEEENRFDEKKVRLFTSSRELHSKLMKKSMIEVEEDDIDNLMFKKFKLKKGFRENMTKSQSKWKTMSQKVVTKIKEAKAQGRMYSTHYARQPGGLRVEDMIFGINMAHLSVTDDTDERMSTSSPNSMETLKMIINNAIEEKNNDIEDPDFYDSHALHLQPLSVILDKYFDLKLDCFFDESGLRQGHPIDTQGFIASNDDIIVLSFRFTTSLSDWLTNLSFSTTEWTPNKKNVGFFNCLFGGRNLFCCKTHRVQTGYYTNFLYIVKYLEKHIIPKLQSTTKPKKVYSVGTSLGAAMATVAFIWLLEKHDWKDSIHELLCVTAGSPRVCNNHLANHVQKEVKAMKENVKIIRCVYHRDMVPHMPLRIFSYRHLEKLVYISKYGDVVVNPRLKPRNFGEFLDLYKSFREKDAEGVNNDAGKNQNPILTAYISKYRIATTKSSEEQVNRSAEEKLILAKEAKSILSLFEEECAAAIGPIKDHMPFWYINHLQNLRMRENKKT